MISRFDSRLTLDQKEALKEIFYIRHFYKGQCDLLSVLAWWQIDDPFTHRPFTDKLKAESYRQALIDLWQYRADSLIEHYAAILPPGLIVDAPRAGFPVQTFARPTEGRESVD